MDLTLKQLEELWRREKEEQERKKKRAAAEWRKNPVRGEPIKGRGRNFSGHGRPYMTLRLRHLRVVAVKTGEANLRAERLIGGHGKCRHYKPAWLVEEERGRALERKMWRVDSDEADGTFAEFEGGVGRMLVCEDAYQGKSEPIVRKSTIFIGGIDDREGDEDEVMKEMEGSWEDLDSWQEEEYGLSCEDEGGDENDGDEPEFSDFELQIQHMLDEGFEVKGGEAECCVARKQSLRKRGWPKRCNGRPEAHSIYLPSPKAQIFLRGEEEFSQS